LSWLSGIAQSSEANNRLVAYDRVTEVERSIENYVKVVTQQKDTMELTEYMWGKLENAKILIKKGDRAGGCRDLAISHQLNSAISSRLRQQYSSLTTAEAEVLKAQLFAKNDEVDNLIAGYRRAYCQ